MTSFKLFQENYDCAPGEHGTVTIMMNADFGDFFLIRDGIPHGDDEDEIDDPGINISAEDMEAFCRAALSYIENFKTKPAPSQEEPAPSPKEPNIEEMTLFDACFYKKLPNYPSTRLLSQMIKMLTPKPWKDVTVGDIIAIPRAKWMEQHGFGRKALNELDGLIENLGLWYKWASRKNL